MWHVCAFQVDVRHQLDVPRKMIKITWKITSYIISPDLHFCYSKLQRASSLTLIYLCAYSVAIWREALFAGYETLPHVGLLIQYHDGQQYQPSWLSSLLHFPQNLFRWDHPWFALLRAAHLPGLYSNAADIMLRWHILYCMSIVVVAAHW